MTDYKTIVIDKENEIRKQISIKNIHYAINNGENFEHCKYQVDNKEDIAQFIYENYDKMKDEDIKYYVTKCLSVQDMRRILLEFELRHKRSEQQANMLEHEEFIKCAVQILNKYQSKGGGYKLEDTQWKISLRTPLKIKFTNTIDVALIDDDDVNIFIDQIVDRLNQLSINYKVESSYKEDTDMKLAVVIITALKYNQ